MGVLPGGATDVNTTDGIYLVSAYGNGDMSAADLVGNDEATVKAVYKNRYLNNSSSVWGNPSGVLAQVFGVLGAVPGMGLVEAIIAAIINAIVAVLGPIPIIGSLVETLASFLGVTHTTAIAGVDNAATAQTTAESALALASQTAAQVAAGAGMSYSDGFGRTTDPTAQTDLGAAYNRDADSGSGTWGVDGAGNVHAVPSGSTPQEFRDHNTAAVFTTDKQAGSVVVSTPPQGAGGFGTLSCRTGISLRENAAGTTKVVAYNDSGVVEVGYYLSGVYHQLGTQAATQTNGDLFEFHAGCDPGTGYDDYAFEVLLNNHVVYTVTDSGHASQKGIGGGFKYGGLIARCGTVVFFFATIQTAAPTVQIFNLFDRM